jgi:hypothetical protein
VLVLYFLVTGVARLPEVCWAAVGVIGAVVLACLSLALMPVFDPPSARCGRDDHGGAQPVASAVRPPMRLGRWWR